MTFTNGFALVIGIGTYANTPKLNVPITAQDAKEIAEVLKDQSKCGYPAQQVTLLNDAEATRDRILQELDAIAQKVSDSDTFFLFYSGHGEYGTDGYYLTTHDTQLENKKVVTGTGISEKELLEKLRAIKAKRTFLFFNACHSGEISPRSLGDEQPEENTGSNIPDRLSTALLGTGEGRVVITACRETQKSYFSPKEDLTIFADILSEGLRGRGIDSRKGYISAFDLYEHIYTNVKQEVEKRFGKFGAVQEPELTILKGVGVMAIALHRGKTPEGDLSESDRPSSLGGAVREVEPSESQQTLHQILSGEINLAAGRDIQNVTIGKSTVVTQHFGDVNNINTGGGDYAGGNIDKSQTTYNRTEVVASGDRSVATRNAQGTTIITGDGNIFGNGNVVQKNVP
ncbi:caspase family protein [Pseudanabaena sp. ABRG5-3]|uniref:caspase family protein n=1 Tax=Pseudanabaena sp. ABRG5-3 TaxID=685565 RepID=UPI000DC6EDD6|nr:caspase family protein [Pseudanabaena sp. ABRG5-3]BBC26651.1 peptidase C14, caspase catalytic subunit p20 [Pseudanabaena sp. ABRG5-3]